VKRKREKMSSEQNQYANIALYVITFIVFILFFIYLIYKSVTKDKEEKKVKSVLKAAINCPTYNDPNVPVFNVNEIRDWTGKETTSWMRTNDDCRILLNQIMNQLSNVNPLLPTYDNVDLNFTPLQDPQFSYTTAGSTDRTQYKRLVVHGNDWWAAGSNNWGMTAETCSSGTVNLTFRMVIAYYRHSTGRQGEKHHTYNDFSGYLVGISTTGKNFSDERHYALR
jgi:hypothetical protein